jgi:hypothetical protein
MISALMVIIVIIFCGHVDTDCDYEDVNSGDDVNDYGNCGNSGGEDGDNADTRV